MRIKRISYEEMTDLPPTVYKYRSWADAFHKEIITEQIVFMARPTSFEDPLDCKLRTRYDLLTKEDLYSKYLRDSKKDYPARTRQEHRIFAREWAIKSPIRNKEHNEQLQKDEFEMWDNRFGVLSLTANPTLREMWDKYSDHHRGFCVGFNSENMFKYLGGGGPVTYFDKLPDILPSDSLEERHSKQVFSKEAKWGFEKEYRTHKFFPFEAMVEHRRIKLPKDCYAEIIFGANLPEVNKQEIVSICTEQGLEVEFYIEAIHDNDEISIDKVLLS
jgi:hypothetical protein